MTKPAIMVFFMALFLSSQVNATDCYDRAGRDYHVDPDLLRAVAWQESTFRPDAVGKNRGKGYGVGLMQIDSQHFPMLKNMGISEQRLLNDACMNVYTGAYFLALAVRKYGYSWQAVGAYNAGFKQSEKQAWRRYYYASLVYSRYQAIKLWRQQKSRQTSHSSAPR